MHTVHKKRTSHTHTRVHAHTCMHVHEHTYYMLHPSFLSQPTNKRMFMYVCIQCCLLDKIETSTVTLCHFTLTKYLYDFCQQMFIILSTFLSTCFVRKLWFLPTGQTNEALMKGSFCCWNAIFRLCVYYSCQCFWQRSLIFHKTMSHKLLFYSTRQLCHSTFLSAFTASQYSANPLFFRGSELFFYSNKRPE